ncbi:MAG: hypothetical protein IAF08_04605 [Rhizobacter sp.]|nr:hypothetical protein [Chlorobiales bacterium]
MLITSLSLRWQRMYGRCIVSSLAVVILQTPVATAQETVAVQNPCQDSLFIELGKLPAVSLTESERRYIDQKKKECEEFESRFSESKFKKVNPKHDSTIMPIATMPPIDSTEKLTEKPSERKTALRNSGSQPEELFTARNLGILAAIAAAVVALAVVLGGTIKAPFF